MFSKRVWKKLDIRAEGNSKLAAPLSLRWNYGA